MVNQIWHAMSMSLYMLWSIFWGLSLGFLFSAIIEVAISKNQMSKLLPDSRVTSLLKAMSLGAISSSCSYAAVAMARSIVRKGGDFVSAMVFQLAATNLVLELMILMWLLLSWQFAVAEFVGSFIMVAIIVALFHTFPGKGLKKQAIHHAESDVSGPMDGHAAMSMGQREGGWKERLLSPKGWTAISHYFVMNWSMLWKDIGVGLLIAGMLGAWVPKDFWSSLFLLGHPTLAVVWGILLGPLIAIISFTCSIGNIPLAVILWHSGLSFGGVAAFIFADLIIPPIINIYRKYYGAKMAAYLFAIFYIAMVGAGALVQIIFSLLGMIPQQRDMSITQVNFELNYTAVLNIIFFLISLILIVVFLKSGGPAMMKMMNKPNNKQQHGETHHHG
ncbi:permease [Acerihabitans sp. TG2]|uniref:permease n=1 Tax=Acerihabitans sp. TG2 TaxID=3096008 RepID=UPI002B22995D|nr:permease [Acerihabitans sp. TG2]MEA9392030.1 permease [Acerihabitans sp. TG2]